MEKGPGGYSACVDQTFHMTFVGGIKKTLASRMVYMYGVKGKVS